MNEWDRIASSWDDEAGARAYAAAAFTSLTAILDQQGQRLVASRVCDFGCGTGLLTERLIADGASVDAVDTSEGMLAVLRTKARDGAWCNVTVSPGVPTASPLQPYDIVVCSSVCSFLDDYPATVGRLVKRLRPGGLFIQWDWELDSSGPDGHGLSRDEMRAALAAGGLVDLRVDTGFEVSVGEYVMRPLVGHGTKPLPRTMDEVP